MAARRVGRLLALPFWGALQRSVANWNNISPLTGLPVPVLYIAGVLSSVVMICVAAVRIAIP
ncbi:hypothetical protein P6F26_17075 [Roseibacterium sp. SDUM158017]|uniref:hypothetical protein n=1 Tax=Roseicyclus salinarum TaxID=3036773 RepID=UPI002414F985|nr:hypothetical protein [Roseibacterium sp. SDUM158017]MDG4650164.1 hypothetical protein [Roseibacterium sp. SDUM158017]